LLANHSFVLGDLNYRCSLPNSSRGLENNKTEKKLISQKMVQLADWKTSWIDVRKLESMKEGSKSSRKRSSRKSSQSGELTLDDYVRQWAFLSPDTSELNPLAELLVTVTDTFPPNNKKVEPHDYFSKWRPLAEDVFNECGDELRYLLKRSLKKMKMFVDSDRVPTDLTERQSVLFRKLRSVFNKSEQDSF